MERIQKIWEHPLYQQCLSRIRALEENRIFCRHTPEHFLDVARLAWIQVLEQGLDVSRPVVYGAALLHDIGRFRQDEEQIPHEQARAELAEQILPACGFSLRETRQILDMIGSHRRKEHSDPVNAAFYRADKLSRCCFLCRAREECDWSPEKKNLTIKY